MTKCICEILGGGGVGGVGCLHGHTCITDWISYTLLERLKMYEFYIKSCLRK